MRQLERGVVPVSPHYLKTWLLRGLSRQLVRVEGPQQMNFKDREGKQCRPARGVSDYYKGRGKGCYLSKPRKLWSLRGNGLSQTSLGIKSIRCALQPCELHNSLLPFNIRLSITLGALHFISSVHSHLCVSLSDLSSCMPILHCCHSQWFSVASKGIGRWSLRMGSSFPSLQCKPRIAMFLATSKNEVACPYVLWQALGGSLCTQLPNTFKGHWNKDDAGDRKQMPLVREEHGQSLPWKYMVQ